MVGRSRADPGSSGHQSRRSQTGQERSLDRLRRSLKERKRSIDVFGALFACAINEADVPMLGMATGESLACLNYLMHRGEVTREADADGVNWYRLNQPQA